MINKKLYAIHEKENALASAKKKWLNDRKTLYVKEYRKMVMRNDYSQNNGGRLARYG